VSFALPATSPLTGDAGRLGREKCFLGGQTLRTVVRMSDPTEEFFDELGRHGHERLLKKSSGSIRFDLAHDGRVDHWFVAIANGDVRVSREERGADMVIHAERAFFERLARGEAKPLSAWLRNDIVADGQFRFILLLERLFPPPPGAHHPRTLAGDRGRPR
jgi:putative sterol carrier protein